MGGVLTRQIGHCADTQGQPLGASSAYERVVWGPFPDSGKPVRATDDGAVCCSANKGADGAVAVIGE
jgi:hypothetical protein